MKLSLPDSRVSDVTVAAIRKTIERAKHAHYVSILLRINGEDVPVEGDWIKYLKIEDATRRHESLGEYVSDGTAG